MELSRKSLSIKESPTLALDAKEKKMRAEGKDVIGFCAGQPDFDTPGYIKEAAIKAINEGFTKYTPVAGDLGLRKAICNKFSSDNGLEYSPENIVVSNGAKHSLMNAFQAILNPGDEVIIPGPYWVSYPEMVRLADGIPVFVDASEENGFKIGFKQLRKAITKKTKAIVINSPSNPTGILYTKDELLQIADIAEEKGIFIISDEIYEKLVYDDNKHISIASLNSKIKDLTIIINGVSKTYAMTGWRIGYSASSQKISNLMCNIQSHATSNPNSIAQKAAEAALNGPQDDLKAMVAEFAARRNYMVERINSINKLSCIRPAGAFYVMMNISKLIGKSVSGRRISCPDCFGEALLDIAGVAVVPGSGFGSDKHVRLSYATSMENIKEGLNRIERFIDI